MAIRYKIDVLEALKDAGFTTDRIRKEKLLPRQSAVSLDAKAHKPFGEAFSPCREAYG